MQALPHVIVCSRDIERNQSDACVVCLEQLSIGSSAHRMPCGHLFHEHCIKAWLKKGNQCPVCRYELATDDMEYEKLRLTRMADRKLRLHMSDLNFKTVHEITRLADHLQVRTSGCYGKRELIEQIMASPQVEIIGQPPDSLQSAPSKLQGNAGRSKLTRPDFTHRLAELDRQLNSEVPGPGASDSVGGLADQIMAELRQTAAGLGVRLDGCAAAADSEHQRNRLTAVGQTIVAQSAGA